MLSCVVIDMACQTGLDMTSKTPKTILSFLEDKNKTSNPGQRLPIVDAGELKRVPYVESGQFNGISVQNLIEPGSISLITSGTKSHYRIRYKSQIYEVRANDTCSLFDLPKLVKLDGNTYILE